MNECLECMKFGSMFSIQVHIQINNDECACTSLFSPCVADIGMARIKQRKAASIQPINEIIARPGSLFKSVAIDFVIKETTFRRLSSQCYNRIPFFFSFVCVYFGGIVHRLKW